MISLVQKSKIYIHPIYVVLFSLMPVIPGLHMIAFYNEGDSTPKTNKVTLKIIDADSSLPIPYATVISKSDSAIANEYGLCQLTIDQSTETVIISSIGYKPDTLQIHLGPNITTIKLTPVKYDLPSVEIKSKGLSAKKIVAAAINRISNNYIQHAHNADLFYRFSVFDKTDSMTYQSESIAKYYDSSGYRKKNWRKTAKSRFVQLEHGRILHGQRAENQKLDELRGIAFFWSHEAIVAHDKPLSNKVIDAYDFNLINVFEYNRNNIFEISFTCRDPNRQNSGLASGVYMSGKIYINEEDFAVIRYEENSKIDYTWKGKSTKRRGNKKERRILESSKIELYTNSDYGYHLEYAKVVQNHSLEDTKLNNDIAQYGSITMDELQFFNLNADQVQPLTENLFDVSTSFEFEAKYWDQFNLVMRSN